MVVNHDGHRGARQQGIVAGPRLSVHEGDGDRPAQVGVGQRLKWMAQVAHEGLVLSPANDALVGDAAFHAQFLGQQIAQGDCAGDGVGIGIVVGQDEDAAGIAHGCNPPLNTRFCPDRTVARGEMAAFLNRAVGLPDSDPAGFTDVADSVFTADIDRLAAAGITKGCNPPVNTLFCPDQYVTRAQMATFLFRALAA